MKAVIFERFGGPEVLEWRDLPDPQPGPGTAIVRIEAAGLNYADIYRRQGNYHMDATPPWVLGYEGAGVIVALDPEASAGMRVGDRVGFADSPRANAELVAVPLDRLVPLPDGISSRMAAAVMLQGLTAQYLIGDSYVPKPGDIALVHAAAGGVGLLLTQMLVSAGATVIGLTSSPDKADAAMRYGATLVLSHDDDWASAILERFGRGVDVVYESTGSTLAKSLAALRTGGILVFYGFAGGNPPLLDPRQLMDRSLTVTGGDLWNVLTSAEERRSRANTLFAACLSGVVQPVIAAEIAMQDAAQAHRLLEGRGMIGKILLVP